MKARIKTLISSISENMYEREQIIALSLLAGIAGANTFLYGSPGTAKSLISRRIASAFEVSNYFEYLMNRFSTPEEIFGPVSIKALKQDQYIRKTEHYLPRADFAFLDEIWKASPAILNTLLTLVNEKIFKNGELLQQVPLKVLISASNEIPERNQGLDALYDRFILRLNVNPIQQAENFHHLLQAKPSSIKVQVPEEIVIKESELLTWREQIYAESLPDSILAIFDEIKHRLNQPFEDEQVYVSDRRWQRVAYLVKAAAFLNDRLEVLLSDLFILKHCLWNQLEDQSFVANTISDVIGELGLSTDLDFEAIMKTKDDLEQAILNQFFYTDDVYESYLISNKEYLRAVTNLDHHYKDKVLYLELNKMGTKKDFFAIDESGHEIRGIVCNFNGSRQCTLKGGYYGLEEVVTPYIKYTKGTPRSNVSAEVKYDLLNQTLKLKDALTHAKNLLKQRFHIQSPHFDSVFVDTADIEKLKANIQLELERYAVQIQDTERLEQLCKQ
ncbi:AAA family ATPase [Acinetobacter shaoyimingii]|uniref:AAA domain-containing protein n=1 Tax=Acinetobacter shaoyimingii TaxID=2715164 RepID=A0A6G8RTY5_9GAMM|nr:AAA family ATPase [Acinetobacter shaoyimingii]QIO05355.1 AAA domain-containing protein [Acinetobacter shaoyimingii]